MNQFPVDVDAEAIFLDNAWYTREDLARRIKTMLDQGDFAISKPSAALEELTQTLQSVRTLSFRATPDLADALNQLATRTDKPVGQLLREAVGHLVTHASPMSFAPVTPPARTPPHHDPGPANEPAAVAVQPARGSAPTPQVQVARFPAQGAAVKAGPGALRAAGVARDSEPTVEVSALDARWFKQ